MPTDYIAPIFMLLVVEPCIAIICICLPTIAPALQDITSYSTIEYLKMVCRIKTAVALERSPSVERAEVYTPTVMRERNRSLPVLGLPWVSELLKDEESVIASAPSESLGEIPEKPIMARGRWMSV